MAPFYLPMAVQKVAVMDGRKNPTIAIAPAIHISHPRSEAPIMTTYGYARVSTADQKLDNQRDKLIEAGADKIFSEKESGAKSDRMALAKALAALKPGDTLLVTRLDRLARSTLDLLNTLEQISTRKADFRSLSDPWADTTTPHGKLMLTVLGGIAEFERSLIRMRCDEGIQKARARGVRFGRKPILTKFQIDEAKRRLEAGESQSEIGRMFGVSYQTIGRIE
jgi:DNA invertase Pin-like site-specific DNA recombinase